MKLLLLSFLLIVPTPLTFYAFVFFSSFFYFNSLVSNYAYQKA